MRTLLAALIIAAGGMAFAEGTAGPGHIGTESKPMAKKLDHKAARNECLKENKNIKGSELKKCIQSKTM